ncbi:MAG: hypothetical protein K0R57_6141 [Paenibacillaceae bacterium]|jgi:DNA-binding LacI/PurR family transcriptional regulator|nr:hypothetical protein [Paenibacillaceae bacterium]
MEGSGGYLLPLQETSVSGGGSCRPPHSEAAPGNVTPVAQEWANTRERTDAAMELHVIVQPDFADSVWCRQMIHGMEQEASKKRYRLSFLKDAQDYSQAASGDLIVIETSPAWIRDISLNIAPCMKQIVLVSSELLPEFNNSGSVTVDYDGAMKECIRTLYQAGRKKLALYGVNPGSTTDLQKKRSFLQYGGEAVSEQEIFYNSGSVDACYQSFAPFRESFDAVICANDILAASLLTRLSREEARHDLEIVGFGNSMLIDHFSMPISSISVDYEDLGVEAVRLCGYLRRSRRAHIISVRTPCTFRFRSEELQKACEVAENAPQQDAAVDFFSDPEVGELLGIEALLRECDQADLQIIRGWIDGSSYEELTEQIHLSHNALKYRIRKMLRLSGMSSMNKLAAAMGKYHSKL